MEKLFNTHYSNVEVNLHPLILCLFSFLLPLALQYHEENPAKLHVHQITICIYFLHYLP